MSLPAKSAVVAITMLAVFQCRQTPAQTIADYSQAQRAWLQTAMTQSAARAAHTAPSAPSAPAAQGVAPAVPAPGPVPLRALPQLPRSPALHVSGVFSSGTVALAEILVDATAYLLEPGQSVPGTGWQVDVVAVDHVVLSQRGATVGAESGGARKVFSLPAMR
jgi:hypothetical protein